jgi:hypothetical protein
MQRKIFFGGEARHPFSDPKIITKRGKISQKTAKISVQKKRNRKALKA